MSLRDVNIDKLLFLGGVLALDGFAGKENGDFLSAELSPG